PRSRSFRKPIAYSCWAGGWCSAGCWPGCASGGDAGASRTVGRTLAAEYRGPPEVVPAAPQCPPHHRAEAPRRRAVAQWVAILDRTGYGADGPAPAPTPVASTAATRCTVRSLTVVASGCWQDRPLPDAQVAARLAVVGGIPPPWLLSGTQAA